MFIPNSLVFLFSCFLFFRYYFLTVGVDRIESQHDFLTSQSALPAGYVYLSFSNSATDKTCSKTSVQVGVPANTCVAVNDKSYKLQLVEGNYIFLISAVKILISLSDIFNNFVLLFSYFK